MGCFRVFTDGAEVDPLDRCSLASLLLGDPEAGAEDLRVGRFDRLKAELSDHYVLSDAASADVFLLPFDLRARARYAAVMDRYRGLAAASGRPLIAFMLDDHEASLGLPGIRVWRASLRASRRMDTELPMPGFCDDIVANHLGGRPEILPKPDKPTIGFVGMAASRRPADLFRASVVLAAWRLGRTVGNPGKYLRAEALDRLSTDTGIVLDAQVRTDFFHFRVAETEDRAAKLRAREAFVRNLRSNAYILAVRGNGNYSFRFYEALCMGRIPIVLSTDILLPLSDRIDYDRHCVIVPFERRHRIADYVRRFHERHTPAEFEALQVANRDLWQTHLSGHGFFASLADDLCRELHGEARDARPLGATPAGCPGAPRDRASAAG